MKKILAKKYYIILIVILGIVGFSIFSGNGNIEDEYILVERSNLSQKIFETGSTEKGEDVTISFKEGGRVDQVLVKEGQNVKRGDVVAVLNTRDLQTSLKEARARLISAEAGLEGVLIGAKDEDVDVFRAGVDSAKTALQTAQENLKRQERLAEESLKTVHRGSSVALGTVNLLGDIYSNIRDIELGVIDIAREYFSSMVVAETTSGRRSRDVIRRSVGSIEDYKNLATRDNVDFQEKEDALRSTERELRVIIGELDNLIDVAESDFYKDRFADADINLLRNYRRTVNNRLNDVVSLLGNISSVNAEVDASLTSARGSVSSAKSNLNEAERRLSQAQADPRSSDVRVREADVIQARAQIELLENRISDATLVSPVNGVISAVMARSNEVVTGATPIATLSPDEDVQITVDIYEGDISKITEGDEVVASFVAFEDREFPGEVVFVNPTGKIVDGVVYYEIKIMLDHYPENVLPQMTVDVVIKTEEKEDVLVIPERVIIRRDGKRFVNIKRDSKKWEVEIRTGIRGEGRMIEVKEGLREGDKIINDR